MAGREHLSIKSATTRPAIGSREAESSFLVKLCADAAFAVVGTVIVALILASLSASGVINITLAGALLVFAWLVGVAGSFAVPKVWRPTEIHRTIFIVIFGLMLVGLYAFENTYQPHEKDNVDPEVARLQIEEMQKLREFILSNDSVGKFDFSSSLQFNVLFVANRYMNKNIPEEMRAAHDAQGKTAIATVDTRYSTVFMTENVSNISCKKDAICILWIDSGLERNINEMKYYMKSLLLPSNIILDLGAINAAIDSNRSLVYDMINEDYKKFPEKIYNESNESFVIANITNEYQNRRMDLEPLISKLSKDIRKHLKIM